MEKKRLAVFASGRGSNFRAILNKIKSGEIPAQVALCITNNPNAGVIAIGTENNIPVAVFIPKEFSDMKAFNDAILQTLIDAEVDIIVLAGYLKLIGSQIVDHFANKILNIHPALLPAFGGKGMYGHHVHDAVFRSGVKVSGASVHLVNNEFDAGPIVMQKCISIATAKSPEEIAERVLTIEHEIYPMAVKLLAEDRLVVHDKRVEIEGDYLQQ